MPSERERALSALIDIHQNITRAQDFISGLTYEAFKNDIRTIYAVTRALEIVSEASRRLPQEVKERHTDIPWTDIAGAGNVYRHDYEDVQERFLWVTVEKHLEPLLRVVRDELGSLGARPSGP